MARHKEPLDQGLWTADDPGVLAAGQLQAILNGVYKPGSQALQRATGRAVFGTATATGQDIDGLRDLKFDNGNHYLVAHVSSNYVSAVVGESGTFGLLASGVGIGSQLEAVQYRNRFFLFNGVAPNATATAANSNTVVYLSATATANTPLTRQHGMNPTEAAPVITTAAGTATVAASGYYEYWTTEVAQIVQDGASSQIENTFIGAPATVLISATSVVPTIQRPEIKNPALTTHWRIYRSPKKEAASDKEFPTGFLISSDISTAATAAADTSVTVSASAFPASMNGVGDGATVWADFTNAVRLSADDDSDATAVSNSLIELKQQGVYGFNLGGFSGSVVGITVEVEALVSTGTSSVGVRLCRGRQSDGGILPAGSLGGWEGPLGRATARVMMSAAKSFTATTGRVKYTLGGATDRWVSADNPIPFPDSAFSPGGFMVLLSFADSVTTTLSVDYVKVTVHYGGTFDSVVVFPTVAYTFGDVTAQVGKNGPPPSSSTGDIFEDTLVVNDVSNPSMIRYSYPSDPEAFPATYYLDFETRDNDSVKCIKVVNNRCMVWLSNALFRLNYLPSERDASFDRGKATEAVSIQYGAINPMCVAIYSPEGPTQKAAFVSHKGIFATDGYSLEELTGGLDWNGVISKTSTSAPICLINNPEDQELVFYYRNDGSGNESYLALHLNYATEHLINGRPKISGPVAMRNYLASPVRRATLDSAWPVLRSDGRTSIYYGYGGTGTAAGAGMVYIASGSTIPAQSNWMSYQTREMYLAGYGNEWRCNELTFYISADGAVTASAFSIYRLRDESGSFDGESNAVTFTNRRIASMPMLQGGETIAFRVSASGAVAQKHHFLLVDGSDFGLADPGR